MKAYLLLTVSALSLTIAATSAHAARDPIIGSSSDSVSVYKSADSTLKAHFGGAQDGHQKDYARTERETPPTDDDDDDNDPDDDDDDDDDDDGGPKCEHENKGGSY